MCSPVKRNWEIELMHDRGRVFQSRRPIRLLDVCDRGIVVLHRYDM